MKEAGEGPAIRPSVLDMLRVRSEARADSRLAALLREDPFARQRFLQWGVPLGQVDAEQLRFRGWQRVFGVRLGGVADVQWSPRAEAIACLTPGALELLRWPDASQQHAVGLPFSGSRVRWVGEAELLVCSGSSGRLLLADLRGAEVALAALECEALTTLQDAAGTAQGLVYAGARDGSVFVWDRRVSAARCAQLGGGARGGGGSVNCVEVARDGQMLVCGSASGALSVWDLRRAGRQPAAQYAAAQLGFAGATGGVAAMRLEPESNSRVALQLADGRCSLFDLASLSAAPLLGPAAAVEGERSQAALSFVPGAPWVAATGAHCVKLMHTGRRRKEATLDVHAAVSCLSCHGRDGLVFGTRTGELVVFGHPYK